MRTAALLATLSMLSAMPAKADGFFDAFRDPEDGAFDASEWLLDQRGFLPVPIVITEPAVGYGGGVALLFFEESMRDAASRAKDGHVTPPNIYAGIVAGTENGTKFGGAGGMMTFKEDRWRYRGFIGNADVNLDFYGVGGDLGTGDLKIGYNLDGWVSSQQVLRRLGKSNQYLAARWVYLDFDTKFDVNKQAPILENFARTIRSSGLGISWEFDTRDNIFTPAKGFIAAVESLFYDPDWGSDESFQTYRARIFAYWPLGKQFVLGTRLDGRAARGDVPFYQLPYIEMRGIPAVRYQDENTTVAEAELRWNVTPRWALVGFLGAGRAWGSENGFSDADTRTAGGAGFRYLIARRLGLYVGMDYARGPDDDAIYIQVGGAWR
jgi:hypothetical protein